MCKWPVVFAVLLLLNWKLSNNRATFALVRKFHNVVGNPFRSLELWGVKGTSRIWWIIQHKFATKTHQSNRKNRSRYVELFRHKNLRNISSKWEIEGNWLLYCFGFFFWLPVRWWWCFETPRNFKFYFHRSFHIHCTAPFYSKDNTGVP